MAWRVELAETAVKQLAKLDRTVARRITTFLRGIAIDEDGPRSRGKALSGPLGALWSYRVGDWRIICDLKDNVLCILVIRIGHRGDVYR